MRLNEFQSLSMHSEALVLLNFVPKKVFKTWCIFCKYLIWGIEYPRSPVPPVFIAKKQLKSG